MPCAQLGRRAGPALRVWGVGLELEAGGRGRRAQAFGLIGLNSLRLSLERRVGLKGAACAGLALGGLGTDRPMGLGEPSVMPSLERLMGLARGRLWDPLRGRPRLEELAGMGLWLWKRLPGVRVGLRGLNDGPPKEGFRAEGGLLTGGGLKG